MKWQAHWIDCDMVDCEYQVPYTLECRSASEARDLARVDGWGRRRGSNGKLEDVCPSCLAKMGGDPPLEPDAKDECERWFDESTRARLAAPRPPDDLESEP
jgi:hypothetical protein